MFFCLKEKKYYWNKKNTNEMSKKIKSFHNFSKYDHYYIHGSV